MVIESLHSMSENQILGNLRAFFPLGERRRPRTCVIIYAPTKDQYSVLRVRHTAKDHCCFGPRYHHYVIQMPGSISDPLLGLCLDGTLRERVWPIGFRYGTAARSPRSRLGTRTILDDKTKDLP